MDAVKIYAELARICNEQSREQGLHVPEKGKTFAGEAREETVAWSKDLCSAVFSWYNLRGRCATALPRCLCPLATFHRHWQQGRGFCYSVVEPFCRKITLFTAIRKWSNYINHDGDAYMVTTSTSKISLNHLFDVFTLYFNTSNLLQTCSKTDQVMTKYKNFKSGRGCCGERRLPTKDQNIVGKLPPSVGCQVKRRHR